jgi:drug/metabolite transporter (DMT)-like permease
MVVWIPITLGAASLQVARNAAQRGLLAEAGPWGATLVRFLFGLPFSVVFAGVAALLSSHLAPRVSAPFLVACALGGLAQIGATAAMLVSMRRSSFTLGVTFSQSDIPLAALIGVGLGEPLSAWQWVGLVMVTAGLVALGWPARGATSKDWSAGLFGLVAGAGFAVSSNAYRQAALALEPSHPVFAALATLVVVQAMQSVVLVGWLTARDRAALRVVILRCRASITAGLFGAMASALWFTAFALSPAGPVRAVGIAEVPFTALAGRRLFAERLTSWQLSLAAAIVVGVVLAAIG